MPAAATCASGSTGQSNRRDRRGVEGARVVRELSEGEHEVGSVVDIRPSNVMRGFDVGVFAEDTAPQLVQRSLKMQTSSRAFQSLQRAPLGGGRRPRGDDAEKSGRLCKGACGCRIQRGPGSVCTGPPRWLADFETFQFKKP